MFDQNHRAIVDPPVYMDPSDIAAYRPAGARFGASDRFAPLRDGLARWGQFGATQLAGRTFAMACVALEVTQRCNLDCSLCYLSDRSEMAHDVPLGELKRRVRMIRDHYGPFTNVQIAGGDPTLRRAEDLEAIVAHIRAMGLRSALFTNGIRATPALLRRLARAGLDDVAFHVDLTQNRKGYDSEQGLNAVREDYLRRAEGTGLRVQFNTTVFAGNVDEVPALCRFFLDHADRINLVSFQMQADTGRGTLRARDATLITQQSMIEHIGRGLGIALDFGVLDIGHPRCNRYAAVLTAGGAVAPLYDDQALAARLFGALADRHDDWNRDRLTLRRMLRAGLHDPQLGFGVLRWAARAAWRLRGGLLRTRGRVHRLSFSSTISWMQPSWSANGAMAAFHGHDRGLTAVHVRAQRATRPVRFSAGAGRRRQALLEPRDGPDRRDVRGDPARIPATEQAQGPPARPRPGRGRMMRWLVLALAIALSACAGVERLAIPQVQEESPVWADHTPGSVERVDHGAWPAFLSAYLATDAGGVNRLDYGRVTDADRAALDDYLDRLSRTDISQLDRDEQLAFWINLYNAQTVALVLDSYPVRSIRSIKPGGAFSIGPWNEKVVTVKGRPLSLHDIEHGIVRAFWKDPRIHYALNCAAVGCPNLAPAVYSGDMLETALAEAERAYVNDPRGVWFDPKGRLHLSKIYLWYREGFGATQNDVLRGLADIVESEKTRDRLARAPGCSPISTTGRSTTPRPSAPRRPILKSRRLTSG